LWLGGFAVCLLLHLLLHPQRRMFLGAIRWLRRYPAPILIFATSLIAAEAFSFWSGNSQASTEALHLNAFTLETWTFAFKAALRDFALLFHTAIIPPSPPAGYEWAAIGQALLGAFSQLWLASCVVFSLYESEEEWQAFRHTLRSWRGVLCLAVCQLPWWWLGGWSQEAASLVHDWWMPEFLLFLAPVPLALAATSEGFIAAGGIALRWWQRSWASFLSLTITGLALLTLLHHGFIMADQFTPEGWQPAQLMLESLTLAGTRVWLFVTAALLLLPGGYVRSDSVIPASSET
jgi:hypothetical protein